MFYRKYLKRLFDILLSLGGIILLSPVMLVIAFLVKIRLGSPVIFIQKRPGKNANIFEMYKFRSMLNAKDGAGNLLSDELRLTKFGKKLRATSLDELPELFNILKGDMSIVGPRPLLIDYLPLYNAEQKQRHDVRPGLTGLAQVKGRNSVSWEEKFKWDIKYVRNISFRLDIHVLFETVKVVLRQDGIQAEGMATMGRFEGDKKEDI